MADLKFSIVIPYKQRLDNIKVVFSSLADQTMPGSQFEILVGAMEYSPEYVSLCQEFTGRLNIRSVLTSEEWNLSRARNLALRLVSGQVIIILDADMALPSRFLQNLYERYYAHRQNICVVGKMLGYDDVDERDIDTVEILPYSYYRKVLDALEAGDAPQLDARWSPEYASAFARFPWVFARGGLVAVTSSLVRRHELFYDEGFRGWGPEDQEWAFRVAATGTPIVLGQDVYGLHLPHLRAVSTNGETAWPNNRYYLAKWPRLELELALGLGGWLEADRIYADVERELAECVPTGAALGVLRGTLNGVTTLVVGALIDRRSQTPSPEVSALFDDRIQLDVLPLVGFALPYSDRSVGECLILPPIRKLSGRYRDTILREAERVSEKVVASAGPAPGSAAAAVAAVS